MRIFTFNTMEQWTGALTPVYSLEVPDGVDPWKEEEKWMAGKQAGTFYDHLIALGCKPITITQYAMLGNG